MTLPSQSEQPQQTTLPGAGRAQSESLQRHAQELGVLGKFFGSVEHAPLNIAGMILILCLLAMLAIPFMPVSSGLNAGDLLKTFGAVALSALTFLGGYLGGKARS